jgi:predicted dehydrogenase
MKTESIGIIMNGVTGRMGTNQHLLRSILEIIREGGISLQDGSVVVPDPLLVGRNPSKLEHLAEISGLKKWTTSLDAALSDSTCALYFDAQTTNLRFESVSKAIESGKHIYCEKPTALTTSDAIRLCQLANDASVKHGVVQDKLWLPGMIKLKGLIDEGFFGRILSIRGEFGYWVFEGNTVPCQRPSWNYRKEDGGGIIQDMLPHWRYLLDNLFGDVKALSCRAVTHVNERWDELGRKYNCTAEDAVYASFELGDEVIAHFNSSWCVRVRRDDLLTLQVDGTKGSAVAGLRDCFVQPSAATPRPVWNPDIESPINYFDNWMVVPERHPVGNAFKAQWELFLRHLAEDSPFPWDLSEGAKGVQLADKAIESWTERRWVEIPDLAV